MQFIDLKTQQNKIKDKIDQAIAKVLEHGKYIMGPEVEELENQLSKFCGAKYSVSCSSGTDALTLAMLALGIGQNDAVIVPSFTFPASAETIAFIGATPIFVDVELKTFNLDLNSLESAIALAKSKNLNLKAIIAVDLFGHPADYQAIKQIADKHNLKIIADAAQSFGANYHGKGVGTLADITTTSFFPAKPLGCYGDGGAVFTNDSQLAKKMQSLRVHGQGKDRYHYEAIGINGRLDTIQAAILIEKLKIFPEEITLRQMVAENYNSLLSNDICKPSVAPGVESVFAQYTIRVNNRDEYIKELTNANIPSQVYYPKPMHQQTPYQDFPATNMVNSEKLAQTVLSLPMHPYLTLEQIKQVARVVNNVNVEALAISN